MKRRSNGEGSFRKLPSGNWSGQIMVGYTPEGKRKIKTFTAPTKPEVRERMRRYMDDLGKEPESTSAIPFSEWADTWYEDMRTQVEESTYWNYAFTLKTLIIPRAVATLMITNQFQFSPNAITFRHFAAFYGCFWA